MPYIEHLELREVPVLLQNRNGPCALLAIANGLLFLCPQDTVGRVVANLGYPVCCLFFCFFRDFVASCKAQKKARPAFFFVCLVRIYIYSIYIYYIIIFIYCIYIQYNIYIYTVYLCVYIQYLSIYIPILSN